MLHNAFLEGECLQNRRGKRRVLPGLGGSGQRVGQTVSRLPVTWNQSCSPDSKMEKHVVPQTMQDFLYYKEKLSLCYICKYTAYTMGYK